VQRLTEERAYPRAVLEGRLVFLDAEATLSRFMINGEPDGERFEQVVGEAIRGVRVSAVQSGVRAYGEMVGVLWSAGQHSAAVRLEELWNQLLNASDVCLYCAYPIDVLGPEFQPASVDALLCAHSHLIPGDGTLESALERAMTEVLGSRVHGIRRLMRSNHRPSWAAVPRAEAMILWLRNNLPGSAAQILERARQHYRLASSA
jgi:hypothetical protein